MESWDAVVDAAQEHGVLPLIHRWIAAARPAFVPAPIAGEITRLTQVQAMQSLLLASETLSLSRRLEALGIPVIALKGPALAVRAYGSLALRPQMDVDLLVHPRDVDRAMAELASAGYKQVYELAAGQDAAVRELDYHYSLLGPAGSSLELHWGTIKRQFGLRVDDALWWSRTQTVQLGGGEVTTLSNELTLMYLAIHGAKHEWPQVRWIGDIAAVARLQPMDWEWLRATNARQGTLRMLRLALALAADVAGGALPEPAERLAREDAAVPPLVAEVRVRIKREGAASFASSTGFQLGVRERVRDKAAFALLLVVMPNLSDLQTAELPAAWRGLYYVLRPLRLIRRWALLALGRDA